MLPDFMENPNNPGNDQEISVGAGETVTLTESIYEDIKVNDGGTVIFSGQTDVYIEDLETKDDVTILFERCTNLILSDKLSLGVNNQFNPGEENVFVFAEDDATIKTGSTIYGVIYARDKFSLRKGDADHPYLVTWYVYRQ